MTNPQFRPVLETALNSALDHLGGLETMGVAATASLQQLRERLMKPLEPGPLPPDKVIQALVEDTRGGLLGSAGGRFFGWAIGGSLPAALAADWLTSAWDQNAALYACSPAAAVVEEVVGAWLQDILGLPKDASFALVSGCQMAHTTCLAAARHELLQQRGWDVERDGLAGGPQLRVLASNRHGSVERAIRLLGIGAGNVIDLPLDQNEQMSPATLESTLQAAPGMPTIVVLQAGDLNTGSFDPYEPLIALARHYSAWVHIDGAFGMWAAASAQYLHLLDGFQSADSWATDGHKWLNVPYDCGYAFVARPAAHHAAMSHRASYLVHDAEARDQIDWNPEWSRRARGFATYAALRQLGRSGVADLIDRCCESAQEVVKGISRLDGAEILWHPIINQGLVRFPDPNPAATEEDHDKHTDHIISLTLQHGGAFFTGTTWRGRRAMRVSVMNWQTQKDDVESAIRTVAECLAADRHPAEPPPIQIGA